MTSSSVASGSHVGKSSGRARRHRSGTGWSARTSHDPSADRPVYTDARKTADSNRWRDGIPGNSGPAPDGNASGTAGSSAPLRLSGSAAPLTIVLSTMEPVSTGVFGIGDCDGMGNPRRLSGQMQPSPRPSIGALSKAPQFALVRGSNGPDTRTEALLSCLPVDGLASIRPSRQVLRDSLRDTIRRARSACST